MELKFKNVKAALNNESDVEKGDQEQEQCFIPSLSNPHENCLGVELFDDMLHLDKEFAYSMIYRIPILKQVAFTQDDCVPTVLLLVYFVQDQPVLKLLRGLLDSGSTKS